MLEKDVTASRGMRIGRLAAHGFAALGQRRLRMSRLALGMLMAGLGAAFVPLHAAHVKLGEPEVRSTIGSPLWVRIPVEPDSPRDEVPAQRFSLAPGPAQSGIPFIERAEIGLEQVGTRYYLSIRTRTGVGEPVIGLVIRERLPEGTRSREFTLFIDPPLVPDAARLTDAAPSRAIDAIVPPPPVAPVPAPQTLAEARALQAAENLSPRPARKPRSKRDAPALAQSDSAPVSTPLSTLPPASNAPPGSIATAGKSAKSRTSAAPRGTAATLSGPKLSLSMSTGELSVSPNASPQQREELKMRRMLLDLDDLTAALLERQNRIGQLEKELASLSQRMAAAEQRLGSRESSPAPTTQPVAPNAARPVDVPVAAAPAQDLPAAAKKSAAKDIAPTAPARGGIPAWAWGGGLVLLCALAWRVLSRSRDRSRRLSLAEIQEFTRSAAEAGSKPRGPAQEFAAPAHSTQAAARTTGESVIRAAQQIPDAPPAAPPTTPTTSPAANTEPAPVSIEFELPPLDADALQAQSAQASPAAPQPIASAANAPATRRARFIKARYHDIAILNPPLDSPQRLLWQASTLYGEGATDFAKRLLKYAAYSRQLTEEYWLALFELLYREKLANDFIVNARWFRTHHPRSDQWDAVQRVGYLLDPAEPLFAEAAAWSSEEPAHGQWLPSESATPTAPKYPALKLELAG